MVGGSEEVEDDESSSSSSKGFVEGLIVAFWQEKTDTKMACWFYVAERVFYVLVHAEKTGSMKRGGQK